MQNSFIFVKKLEKKYLRDKNYCKVRDHCHYTGDYRGAAYSICKIKCCIPKKFLWFFIMDLTMSITLS